MSNIISQICGLIVSAAAIASMQLKNIKFILICQLICNGIGAASYILLGGLSGCGIYLIALTQVVVCFFCRVKNKEISSWVAGTFFSPLHSMFSYDISRTCRYYFSIGCRYLCAKSYTGKTIKI